MEVPSQLYQHANKFETNKIYFLEEKINQMGSRFRCLKADIYA